jgi:hypothetical protein
MAKNVGFCPLEHVNKNGAYPNLGTIACFGAAGATAGSGITLIACKQLSKSSFVQNVANWSRTITRPF